jgi:hypothetical protein
MLEGHVSIKMESHTKSEGSIWHQDLRSKKIQKVYRAMGRVERRSREQPAPFGFLLDRESDSGGAERRGGQRRWQSVGEERAVARGSR